MKVVFHKLLTWSVTLVAVLGVIAAGELLPPLQWLETFLAARPSLVRLLSGGAMSLAVLGILLLVGTQFLVRVGDETVTHLGAAAQGEAASGIQSRLRQRLSGLVIGTSFQDEATFWQVKSAFRSGDWRRKPRWRRMSLMLLGAICLLFGLFGYFFFVFSAGVKLLMGGAMVYASARTLYGFWAAQPGKEL